MGNQHIKHILNEAETMSLYSSGMSFCKIGKKLGVSRIRVKRLLVKNNVWVEDRDKIKKDFTNKEIDAIKKLYLDEKLSCAEIGKIFSISSIPIKRILKNFGLLRKGKSCGVKISLTSDQEVRIKDLYLNEYKSCGEIGKELKLTK